MKRVITYDLKSADRDDYQELYDVLDQLHGKRLTESSFLIETDFSQKTIEAMIEEAVYPDDVVYYISVDGKTSKLFCNQLNGRR